MRTILMVLFWFSYFNGMLAHSAAQVQLPFYDGQKYRCVQNSNETTSHDTVYTKFDLDFNMKIGDIVVAATDGVLHYGSNPNGFGKYARIDNGSEWTIYGHLRDYIVQDGQYVIAGQPIAYSGNTGYILPPPTADKPSTGQHLHFGVHKGDGTGVSVPMFVYGLDVGVNGKWSGGNLGFLSTSIPSQLVCGLTNGHFYEARPIGQSFSRFSCKGLSDNQGILCWENNPVDCVDGKQHVRYFKTPENALQAESNPGTWQWCSKDTGKSENIFSYLQGGYGVGGAGPGYSTEATDPTAPNRPDFIVTNTWLETPQGIESYKYGLQESFNTKAQSKNIGDGPCLKNEIQTITGHFYLSKGYKEDVHSGDGAWRRIDSTTTNCSNLKPGETHTETKSTNIRDWITVPGIYNIVYCIDHPQDDHNNGGDHKEKHESNNCSTEAVFEVVAAPYVNVLDVDFIPLGLQFRQTPYYAGDQARFGAWIKNQGKVGSPKDIRSDYRVQCPGTALVYLTDDGTPASALGPGASTFEENKSSVTLPNASGTCTAYFCVDYQNVVQETNESNNCQSFSFTLAGRPKPNLAITKFEDESGCCTTNTGDRIKPDIWVRNTGPVAPATNVTVIYQINSPVATGNAWWTIGYGGIEPRELPPGGTDEDYMDGKWSIPKDGAWKKQWHTVRACLRADGSIPFGDPNRGDVCATYTRYSKK